MDREKQRRILEERLVAAVADEYRYGALSDQDYGYRPEKLVDEAHAEGRSEEIREIARDFHLELPAEGDVDERARAAVRQEYEGAADALADLVARTGGGGGPAAPADPEARADPYDLFDAEGRVNHAEPVLRYLDDVEADRRWREAVARELEGEAAEVLRSAGYPKEKVERFVRAGLSVDAGEELAEAADRHAVSAGDLSTYLEERAGASATRLEGAGRKIR